MARTNFPPSIAFSKNAIWFQPCSRDYLADIPTAAVNYIEFDAPVAAAATLSIGWGSTGVVMTAADVPDDTGNQFPDGDGGADYVTSLIPYFQANFFIDQVFDVSADLTGPNPRLIFTAREDGADNNFDPSSGIGVITAGVDDSPLPNFGFRLEVFVDDGTGTFNSIYAAIHQLDLPLTGYTSLDIHEILHSVFDRVYDPPILGDTLYQQCTQSIRAYYLKFAEYFGAIPSVQKIQRSDTFIVAKGGLGMQPALLRDIVAELLPGDNTQALFARTGSKNKLVTMDQPEWLTYINLTGGDLVASLEITITNADASTTVFTSATDIAIASYAKYQFQAGFTQLTIPTRQSADLVPVYYTVRLKTGDGYQSDSYNYIVDYNAREWPGYFVYENAYGAFQTVATVGKGQLEYDRSKDDTQASLDRETAAAIGDFYEANIYLQQKGTVNVGYERSANRETILQRDLLLSHTIFIYQAGALIPVGLTTKNLKDAKQGTNAYANSIEYYYKYQDEVWTETQPQTDPSVNNLLAKAGSAPVPVAPGTSGDTIVVFYGDTHFNAGTLTYTDIGDLGGKTGYIIYSSGMGGFLKISDVTYNSAAGSFTIVIPGFTWSAGDRLVIWPSILTPTRVVYGDPDFDRGTSTYTNITNLGGKTGYVIWSTGLDDYLGVDDVTYDGIAGTFTIITPGFSFSAGDELIYWPSLLIPPTS